MVFEGLKYMYGPPSGFHSDAELAREWPAIVVANVFVGVIGGLLGPLLRKLYAQLLLAFSMMLAFWVGSLLAYGRPDQIPYGRAVIFGAVVTVLTVVLCRMVFWEIDAERGEDHADPDNP